MLMLAGCKARQPGRAETAIMSTIKQKVTVRGSAKNPIEATAEEIESGRTTFGQYCMVCHGLDGQNTGVPFADKMSPPVPLLNSTSVQAYTDGQLHWIIQNGIFPSGMPASKDVFRDEEIWELVLYVRHLPPKGSLGVPSIYGDVAEPNMPRDSVRTAQVSEQGRESYPRTHR